MEKNELLKILDNVKEKEKEVTFTKGTRTLLIDGLNLFFRNFAIINLVNESGVHIGGLSGFLRSLGFLIKNIKPTSVYIVFDGAGGATNRQHLIPEYKTNRNINRITNWEIFDNLEEEDQAKVDQITRLIHYLRCLPLKVLLLDKVEADDIIAYIGDKFSELPDSQTFIVSADKDFLQLVKPNLIVYRPMEKRYYFPKDIKEKFNVLPENFIIYKTLLGDASDKISGVKGLGEKGIHKKFPELSKIPLTMDDLFEICENKIKDHVIYARIIHEWDRLEKNYMVMDLKNPILSNEEKTHLIDKIGENTKLTLKMDEFQKLYHEDGLNHAIRDVPSWLRETFKVLNSF